MAKEKFRLVFLIYDEEQFQKPMNVFNRLNNEFFWSANMRQWSTLQSQLNISLGAQGDIRERQKVGEGGYGWDF